jgi:hypothetical protein
MSPKPPTVEETAPASKRAAETPDESADDTTTLVEKPAVEGADAAPPPAAEVAPESGGKRHSERADAAPKSRRRSSSRRAPRGLGIIPLVIAAAVFVVMFLVGAMRAMRDELRDAKPSTMTPSSVVQSPPAETHPAAPESAPVAPAAVTLQEPIAAEVAAPAPSPAEPEASASAGPAAADGTTRVMMRSAVAGAKFFRNGKQVGLNSVIVELAPGEKRAFEVNLAGYVSRKVVVDGSRPEVVVYLPRISEPTAEAHAASTPSPAEAPAAPQAP